MKSPLFECKDLCVRFAVRNGTVQAVTDFDFSIAGGECLGIVGESGSGKTQSCMAILGLLPRNGSATGSVQFRGQEILNARRKTMDRIRGQSIGMVFQDSMAGLTPFMRIGDQLCEVLIEHKNASAAEARTRALEVLDILQFPQPKSRFDMYPYELSGGMRQRVMIALALICKPDLIIADEPTTALDITIQAQILEFLCELKKQSNTAIVIITHDFGVAAELCDRIIVMYAGRMVESGRIEDIFARPQHPYTQALLHAMPRIDSDPQADLPQIPGRPPNLQDLPGGCSFAQRCAQSTDRCRHERPPLDHRFAEHLSACFVTQPQ